MDFASNAIDIRAPLSRNTDPLRAAKPAIGPREPLRPPQPAEPCDR
jgi:hypothetical protein